jgi:hypothetical protein
MEMNFNNVDQKMQGDRRPAGGAKQEDVTQELNRLRAINQPHNP